MRVAVTVSFLALLLIGCRSSTLSVTPVEIAECELDVFAPGALVPVGESNATDILTLTIAVDELIRSQKVEWPYRRLAKRERVDAGGRCVGINADGERGGYGLSIDCSPMDVITGTNIQFTIRYYGSLDGVRREGQATIDVPVSGTSSGVVDSLRYESEWMPNTPPRRP